MATTAIKIKIKIFSSLRLLKGLFFGKKVASTDKDQIDQFTTESQLFIEWLKANNVEISPKITIHDYRAEGQGRGVIALEDIEIDEIFLKIPRSAVLSVDNDLEFLETVPEAKTLNSWLSLILYMLKASSLKQWGPYFDVLPKKFDTLLHWSEEELEHLAGSAVVEKIGRDTAEQSYNDIVLPIIQAHADYFKDCDTSLEAFLRMGTLVMAYGFDVDHVGESPVDEDETAQQEQKEGVSTEEVTNKEESDNDEDLENDYQEDDGMEDDEYVKGMVPFADSLNAHTKLRNACLVNETDFLVMKATSFIPKGTQVYNTYGDMPNSDLLRRYGYTEANGTEYDVVELATTDIVAAVAAITKVDTDKIFEVMEVLLQWSEELDQVIVDESYDIPAVAFDAPEGTTAEQSRGDPEEETLFLIQFLQLALQSHIDIDALGKDVKLYKKLFKMINKNIASKILTQESLDIWKLLLERRLQDYSYDIVQEGKGEETKEEVVEEETKEGETPAPVLSSITSRKEMAIEVIKGEVNILTKTYKQYLPSLKTVSTTEYLQQFNKELKASAFAAAAGSKKRANDAASHKKSNKKSKK